MYVRFTLPAYVVHRTCTNASFKSAVLCALEHVRARDRSIAHVVVESVVERVWSTRVVTVRGSGYRRSPGDLPKPKIYLFLLSRPHAFARPSVCLCPAVHFVCLLAF